MNWIDWLIVLILFIVVDVGVKRYKYLKCILILILFGVLLNPCSVFALEQTGSSGKHSKYDPILLRAWGVPASSKDLVDISNLKVIEEFQKKFPYIRPVSSAGLNIPGGGRTMDMVPLMQIAGDIPAHVMYVNFRQSDTYIRNKFLYPLDSYIEKMLNLEIKDGANLTNDEYVLRLQRSSLYKSEIAPRILRQFWPVIRRRCPYGEKCPYCKSNGGELDFQPTETHYHTWAFPQKSMVIGLFYDKTLFHEAGLPDRVPRDWDEFMNFARKLTDPPKDRYGLKIPLGDILSWSTLGFLYSTGGRLVEQQPNGDWDCVFDSDQAVEAYYYVARLFHEKFIGSDGQEYEGVVYTGETKGTRIYKGMWFDYIDTNSFQGLNPDRIGFGPIPKGPTGLRGNEINSSMTGIYAGLEGKNGKEIRDAAWEYIKFYNGLQARKIRTTFMVENGLAPFVQPDRLDEAGFGEYKKQIPDGWVETFEKILHSGIPEPYGKNCQNIYSYVSQALDQIRTSEEVSDAINSGDKPKAVRLIKGYLSERVNYVNDKMLSIVSSDTRKFRNRVATGVALGIFTLFVLLFRHVFKVFDAARVKSFNSPNGNWQFLRYKWAYLLLLIPVGSILLWQYYPLVRGSVLAFQDYNIRGFSTWVGMDNFASVLFDVEFWFAVWVNIKYALLSVTFGFTAPIILAFLLTEIPKGKLFYRIIFYMPAVLSGLIVLYLWKSFYGQYGMLNDVVNFFINIINVIPGVELAEFKKNWLTDPNLALLCLVMPSVWAGMGPGCLIYLAALKTIPDDIYEAADIDGAGIWQKIFHVAIPGIKPLIVINFIGYVVGVVKGGGNAALAMTGGGPYTPYGQTEFVGLKIFFQAFGYLRFGVATSMAWILGSMLVGFTVLQLKRLSKMEFKRATGV